MKYIFFGPPGSGKSTLLSHLPHHCNSCATFDLEHIDGTMEGRLELLRTLSKFSYKGRLYVGCADINPNDFPRSLKIILLWCKQKEEYLKRVARRNLERPEKSGQKEEHLYECIAKWRQGRKHILEIDPSDFEGKYAELAQYVLAQTS